MNNVGGPGTPVSITFLAPLYEEAKACALANAYQQKAGFMAPVAFITAHDLEWVKKQAQLAGAIGYFVKPFDGRSLIETLDRHCSPA